MTKPFQDYAQSYDNQYQNKDYKSECDFIEAACKRFELTKCKSILDLGCGTGGHAIPLAERGYKVHGVDISTDMLKFAREKGEKSGASKNLTWSLGDMTSVRIQEQFDLVVCMFAVMSYQITNDALRKSFKTVRAHLRPGGLYVCDFWYGPAVLRDPPVARERWIPAGEHRIKREATPKIDFNRHNVEVNYVLTTYKGEELVSTVKESHTMRYLFLPEMELLGELEGLKLVHASDCCKIDCDPSEKTWTISTVFQG